MPYYQVYTALASPLKVLQLEDDLEVFERFEKYYILESAKVNWEDKVATKEKFCDDFAGKGFSDFVWTDDLFFEERPKSDWRGGLDKKGLCERGYDFNYAEGKLEVSRNGFEKRFELRPKDHLKEENKKSFVIGVEFDFEKEYLCDKLKCEEN